jgi:hypothetical protein
VELNTRGYGGRTLKKTIRVHTNDKQHPVSDLIVTGEVKKFANISPPRIVLNGEVGEELQMVVKVSPASEGLFAITQAGAADGKDIRVTLSDAANADDGRYTLLVENTRTTPGRYRDIIHLLTTNKDNKEILIPVWGNITPRQIVSIRPRHLALTGRAGSPLTGKVTIVPKDDAPLSITETKAQSGAYIRWELKETTEAGKKAYTLTVENLKKDQGRYYDVIFLKTDCKELPEIRISVSARITE